LCSLQIYGLQSCPGSERFGSYRGNVSYVYSKVCLGFALLRRFVWFKSECELLCLLWLNIVKISDRRAHLGLGSRISDLGSLDLPAIVHRPSIDRVLLSPVIKIATCCLLLLLQLQSCCCHIYCTLSDLLLAFIKSAQQLQFNIKNNNKQQRQLPLRSRLRFALLVLHSCS